MSVVRGMLLAMRWCGYLLMVLSAACRFDTSNQASSNGLDDGGTGPTFDADPAAPDGARFDGAPIQPDAAAPIDCDDWELLPAILDPCDDIDVVDEPLNLSATGTYAYDTDLGVLRDPAGVVVPHTSQLLGNGADAPRVLVARNIDLKAQATLRATGTRPLILVSWENFLVGGTIDVGSDVDIGAGANSPNCNEAEAGGNDDQGGGGGGGGGFGGFGGSGADGRNGDAGSGGGGGDAIEAPGFRGGCPGADAGDGQSNIGGVGGSGGGAVYLLARQSLVITGIVSAGGQGGTGSDGDRSGGGGGGSGGTIGIEGASITLSGAVLAANGGGGGGGSNQNTGGDGQAGQASDSAATGGDGEGGGTEANGGDGGFVTVIDGQDGVTSDRGGGGGGGGAGVITQRTNSLSIANSIVSPAASP